MTTFDYVSAPAPAPPGSRRHPCTPVPPGDPGRDDFRHRQTGSQVRGAAAFRLGEILRRQQQYDAVDFHSESGRRSHDGVDKVRRGPRLQRRSVPVDFAGPGSGEHVTTDTHLPSPISPPPPHFRCGSTL